MTVSTKGRLRPAGNGAAGRSPTGGLHPLRDLAAQEDSSKKYLEVIMKTLVKEGLAAGTRGVIETGVAGSKKPAGQGA